MPLARGPWKRTTTEHVAVELARLERVEHVVLVGEAAGGRLDRPAFRVDRAGLEHGAAEIAMDQPHAAVGQERIGCGAEHVDVGAFLGALPDELVPVKLGITDPGVHRIRARRQRVGVDQPLASERVGDERHSARVLEIVHVPRAVGIDPRDQRHRRR